jgi:hypothetical protein
MATDTQVSHASDAAVLARLIRPNDDDLPTAEAKALLNIRFGKSDLDRIHKLGTDLGFGSAFDHQDGSARYA